MSAKEMFEKLHYEKKTELNGNDEPICIYYKYSKCNIPNCEKITFQCFKECVYFEDDRPLIDMPLNKAIQKQIEELGWE